MSMCNYADWPPQSPKLEACVERWFSQLEADGLIAKTPTERVKELRARRDALGMTRLELYVHPADHEAVKAYAAKLQRKREAAIKASLKASERP